MFDDMEQPAETPDSEAAETTAAEDSTEATGQYDDSDDNADSQEQTAEEDEEVEIGDKKVAMPKSLAEKLKAERLMHGDYTQKTQGLAEERRQLVLEREQMAQHRAQAQAHIKELAKVEALTGQLAEYDQVNWDALIASDPVQAMQLQEQRRALEARLSVEQQNVTAKLNEAALADQQTFAKKVQDAEAYIAREVKGMTPERLKVLETYAASEGLDGRAFAKAIIDTPQVVKLLQKAEQFDRLQKKQTPKPPPAAPATPQLRVGSNASVKKDPTQMSDKEFAAHRRKVASRRS